MVAEVCPPHQGGTYKPFMGRSCPFCGFELLLYAPRGGKVRRTSRLTGRNLNFCCTRHVAARCDLHHDLLELTGRITYWTYCSTYSQVAQLTGRTFWTYCSTYSQVARSFPLCARCYQSAGDSNAPADAAAPPESPAPPEPLPSSFESPALCMHCPHPESHPIIAELALCACPQSDGVLIRDPSRGISPRYSPRYSPR